MSTKLIQDPEAIRLNDEAEVQQLLGNPPGWMLQWGVTLVFIVFIVLVVMSNYFRYPDRVSATVVLTSERPAVKIFALEKGRIAELLVKDNELVETDQLLAVIENPADWQDVEKLDQELMEMEESLLSRWTNIDERDDETEVESGTWNDIPTTAPTLGLKLGPIQKFYAELLQGIDLQYYTLSNDANYKQIRGLKNQIRNTRDMGRNIIEQVFLLEQEVALAEKNERRLDGLLKSGATSSVEYEKARSEMFIKQRELKNKKSAHIDNKLEVDRLRQAIIALEKKQSDDVANGNFDIQAKMKELRGAIDEWRLKYTLKTPIEGKVSFSKIWNPHQFVQDEELMMTIVPQGGPGRIIARGSLPAARSGKVDTGMVVNIRLESYPYKEFGILKGKVENIAPVPNPGANAEPIYQITVGQFISPAPGQLQTTYKKPLDFQQELSGQALIITEDRNLWQRLVVDRFNNARYNNGGT